MRKRHALFAACSVLGLGLASTSYATPTVNTSVTVFEADGTTEAPLLLGVYQLQQGNSYKVGVSITVDNPNVTDSLSNRPTATRAKQLGVQTVSIALLTNGTVNSSGLFNPVGDGGGPPQQWTLDGSPFVDVTSQGLGFSFVNLLDDGPDGTQGTADGDLDPDGVGVINSGTTLTGSGAGALTNYQMGVGGEMLMKGDYVATGSGLASLKALLQAATAFIDPAANSNAVQGDPNTIKGTNGEVQLNIIAAPEPASIGLLSLGGLGLLARRRRNA